MVIQHRSNFLQALVCLFLVLSACQKNEDPSPAIVNPDNAYVNDWITDKMKSWYLWTDKIPASTDKNQNPDDFFQSILYSGDRFSWIQDNYIELLNSLQGISREAGYEYVLYKESTDGNAVLAQLLYVKPFSPASGAGLKRGDIITHINNQQITVDNYQSLLKGIRENHSINYKSLVIEEKKFDSEKTAAITPVEYAENPNYLSKVIDFSGRKIGYYVYNFFSSGTDTDSVKYDQEMASVFSNFKAQGITDLVLDLRFNSGGSETAANNLASLIGPGINNSTVFFKREYNQHVQQQILADPRGESSYLTSRFRTKKENIGNQLTTNRLYVLTSSRTASASELIINGLKPYMDVFIIGDTTYGKNVGSISLYEENDSKNTWGMQPIVVKVYNSLGQSDYSKGFVPTIEDKDNSLYLYPLGDIREALLTQAITQITGVKPSSRIRKQEELRDIVGHSLDAKRRSFNLIINKNIPNGLLN